MSGSMDLAAMSQIVGITSSGLFAGYTWALSHAAVPAILTSTDESTRAAQWRHQYLMGFFVSVPCTAINILSWGYLAYHAPTNSTVRTLYTTAALTTGSGTVFAWTLLRPVNGALSIRSKKIAGPGPYPKAPAVTYASDEKWSRDTEARYSTEQLLRQWKWFNEIRTVILVAGTVLGAWGMAIAK